MMHEAHTDSFTPLQTNHTHTQRAKPPRKRKHKHDYQQWLCDPFNPVRGETSLWIAVITQAMMDALSRSRNPEIQYHKHEAIRWLTGNSKDFVEVCMCAGLDPDHVRQKAKRCIASPTPWRAEPGKGKRYLERKAYRKRQRDEAKKKDCKPCPTLKRTFTTNTVIFPVPFSAEDRPHGNI